MQDTIESSESYVTISEEEQDELLERIWTRLERNAQHRHWPIEMLRLAKRYATVLVIQEVPGDRAGSYIACIDAATALNTAEREYAARSRKNRQATRIVRSCVYDACATLDIDPVEALLPLVYGDLVSVK